MQQFIDWLAATDVSQAFGNASWFVPAVQSVHILSIAIVVATMVMLDVRLLHLVRRGPSLSEVAHSYLPWVWVALVVLLVTGSLLIITEPGRELKNFAFWYKMIMVAVLTALTVVCQWALSRDPEFWNASAARRVVGGVIGAVSLVLTILIVAAGRLIAYV
jgi:hypothetical protein